MANQFTSGGGSKGPKKRHDPITRDRIRAEVLAQRMYRFASAKGEKVDKYRMDAGQVAAAKVIIDKGKPSLQAIEQKNINEQQELSPESRLALVSSLISSHPELIAQLNLQPKPVQVDGSEGESAQTLHKQDTQAA